jgi:hypothetical protein
MTAPLRRHPSSGGYFGQVDAGEYGMRDCAKELILPVIESRV